MLNVTARLALKINHLPDWEVDWEDVAPRNSLTYDTFLPNIDDASAIAVKLNAGSLFK